MLASLRFDRFNRMECPSPSRSGNNPVPAVALQVNAFHASGSSIDSRTASGERSFSTKLRWHSSTNFRASKRFAFASARLPLRNCGANFFHKASISTLFRRLKDCGEFHAHMLAQDRLPAMSKAGADRVDGSHLPCVYIFQTHFLSYPLTTIQHKGLPVQQLHHHWVQVYAIPGKTPGN